MLDLIIFIFGLIVGSFLNVVLWRLYTNEPFLGGRSYCPKCKEEIAWYDNIPLLSFLLLGGKCRHCQNQISLQYPFVEAVTAIIFLGLFLSFGLTVEFFTLIIFSSFLIIIFVYDLKYYLILDEVVIPAAIFAFLVNLSLGLSFWNLALAGLIGGGFFLIQFLISKGRWIGGGDIRLGGLMGLMLGWPQILTALILAYVSGAVVGVGLLLERKKQLSSRLPFGTFLSAATIAAMLCGENMLEWYLGIIF